uniref:Uncharacterized protein n=1 Tax=Heterorhabditis bacteriophora TaxID=37862 RepID=A0A1I7WKV9_HETBA
MISNKRNIPLLRISFNIYIGLPYSLSTSLYLVIQFHSRRYVVIKIQLKFNVYNNL